MNETTSRTFLSEHARILWRQRVMRTEAGVAWLVLQVRQFKARERDLGPNHPDVTSGGGLMFYQGPDHVIERDE